MNTFEFLSYLQQQNIRVWAEGDRLRYNAPEGSLTPELRAELANRKAEVLNLLQRPDDTSLPLLPVGRDGALPLSYAQERLWFLEQLEPESPAYNLSTVIRLSGPLDVGALVQSLEEIVRRHEALRTTFPAVNGQPVQVIAPAPAVSLPVVDLQDLPETERESEALQLAAQAVGQLFDLQQGPLFRASLLRLDEGKHILVVAVHHIVFDGWSMAILNRELSVLYESAHAGRPSPLPELPIQYCDYAVWQRGWLRDGVLERQLGYWREQLRGAPVLELPTDHPRPPRQTHHGARQKFVLPIDLCGALRALSQAEGVTLFMTLLAAFQTLLYRYSGQQDLCVGTPIANRRRGELEGLMGFFVNTLVMRTDLSGDPTFRELLGRVRDVALGAFSNLDVPFERVVAELQPVRDMSRLPLVQVMFVLQNAPAEVPQLQDLASHPVTLDIEASRLDLTLEISVVENGLAGRIVFNTALFEAGTIAQLATHYQRILEAVVRDPEISIDRLPLLSAAERHRLLVEWNDTRVDYPQDSTVHELFEAQVDRWAGMPAVVYGDEILTYGTLNERANQLAHCLQASGVGPEVLVGICAERSTDWVVAILGAWKAGGACLPLDPALPPARLALMLEDAQASLVLTQDRLVNQLSEVTIPVVRMDAGWPAIALQSRERPASHAGAKNLAYVVYTSGSTGGPKGVMIQHRSIVNFAGALQQLIYASHPGKRFRLSMNSPIFFDASLQRLLMLLYGHTLYLVPQDIRQDGQRLLAFVRGHRLHGIDSVPAQIKLLLAAGLLDGQGWAPSMATSGGEALDETTWRTLAAAGDTAFYNMYGPTECTVASTGAPIGISGNRPTIGRPLANVRAYILDRQLEPVPAGVPGELHIGGIGVARGYLNRPGLTAGRFVPDPFDDLLGARMYRTGDLARYRRDGNIEFLGRLDRQVKIRGYRVELGEIETILQQHPSVRAAVAQVKEKTRGDDRVVAYVVPEENAQSGLLDLRDFLRKELPSYMVPSAFVVLGALPLTPTGKIDRKALPEPEWSRDELARRYVAPRTPLERMLVDIWNEVLGIDHTGIHDSFFDLGGHSLLAMQILAHICDAVQLEIPLRVLFDSPTVADMAGAIISKQTETMTSEALDQMLAALEELPYQEVQSLLSEKDRGPSATLPETGELHTGNPVDAD